MISDLGFQKLGAIKAREFESGFLLVLKTASLNGMNTKRMQKAPKVQKEKEYLSAPGGPRAEMAIDAEPGCLQNVTAINSTAQYEKEVHAG